MRPFLLALLIAAPGLAACSNEAGPGDIRAALTACGAEHAVIRKRAGDGSQSPYEVDFGVGGSGEEQARCMNDYLKAMDLKPVLGFHQDRG